MLASSHGAPALACSNSMSAGPSGGTCAPPAPVVASLSVPRSVRVTEATKKRG